MKRYPSRYPAAIAPLSSPAANAEPPAAQPLQAPVVKRLAPGTAGTKRLAERFGQALVCVRYRVDPASNRRYTTVELVVDERIGKLPPEVLVRIAYGETDLRNKVKAAGGTWDAERKLWRLPSQAVMALGLAERLEGK